MEGSKLDMWKFGRLLVKLHGYKLTVPKLPMKQDSQIYSPTKFFLKSSHSSKKKKKKIKI